MLQTVTSLTEKISDAEERQREISEFLGRSIQDSQRRVYTMQYKYIEQDILRLCRERQVLFNVKKDK
ncbi:MAG: hypothetical protein ACRC6V_05045 [Bacteroidales bacterium]